MQNSLALLLQPPRIEINFQPNLEINCDYKVKSTEGPIDVFMRAEGVLNESIKITQKKAHLEPGVWHDFKCKITLPSELEPGLHENWVVVTTSSPGGMIGGITGVAMQLFVRVPYPGKFLEGKFEATDAKVDEDVNFKIKLISRGNQIIDKIKGAINIINPGNETIGTINLDEISMEPGATRELKTKWKTGAPGIYTALANIDYDGKLLNLKTRFNVGDLIIEIVNVTAEDVKQGDIATITTEIQSKWNDRLDNVYTIASIKDLEGREVGNTKSESITVESWGGRKIPNYWDTSNIDIGQYDINVTLYYTNKIDSKTTKINILKSFRFELSNLVLIIIIIILILVIIYNARKKKKKK
jgi:hypothetical protein